MKVKRMDGYNSMLLSSALVLFGLAGYILVTGIAHWSVTIYIGGLGLVFAILLIRSLRRSKNISS